MARRSVVPKEDLEEKKLKFENVAGNLELLSVEKFLKNNFLPYAWSFNLDRALVDVTGLKPVHRRILYTMFKDTLSPNANRMKVATLGGKVLAYHPHGNTSVEDALKNLAREHIFRVPLIDGKGDFGVPGTPGAASRYIEARLNAAAWLCVEEIGEHAVRMVPNYDTTTTEPVKIPVKWPVSVINGGSGIAIAYASNMPSHNPTEIMKACMALVKNSDMTHAQIHKIVLGPDFNMGGIVTSNDGIREYLETGSGTFKLRGRYEVTPGKRGTSRIEFHEIPFGSYPEKIIIEIQKHAEKGRFKDIASYKDLSDLKHPIRLIFETKPGVQVKKVIAELFAFTSLESSFSSNITTIVDNKPRQSSMKDLLLDFIEFRKLCVHNKSTYSLEKKGTRLHLIEGLVKTLIDIDAAIAIIRRSDNSEVANVSLQKKFKIDAAQADYVLSLQLRRLTKMDKVELDAEKKNLEAEVKYLNSLLTDVNVLKTHLLKEFDETLKVIGDERKTEIIEGSLEDFLVQEKASAKEFKAEEKNSTCYVARFADGSILKTLSEFSYATSIRKLQYSPMVEQLKMKSSESIILVTNDGMGHKIPLSYVPQDRETTLTQIGVAKGKKLVGLSKVEVLTTDVGLALFTKDGNVKITKPVYPGKDEFPVMAVDASDEVVDCRWIGRTLSGTLFVVANSGGNILAFDPNTLRAAGHAAGGVKGMTLKPGDKVIGFSWVRNPKDAMVLSKSTQGIKTTMLSDIPPKGRGAQGVLLHLLKGNDVLKSVYVGSSITASINGTKNIVNVPPITARAKAGAPLTMDVHLGGFDSPSV